jgi:hypothetical protein
MSVVGTVKATRLLASFERATVAVASSRALVNRSPVRTLRQTKAAFSKAQGRCFSRIIYGTMVLRSFQVNGIRDMAMGSRRSKFRCL